MLKQEITEYFSGMRSSFDVALHTPGTDFQRKVWSTLIKVSYGSTSTYQQLAESIHRPTAFRAVAQANGYNRISIVVPCHRIIGKNGDLTGYGGGLERKKWLLDFEKKTAKN